MLLSKITPLRLGFIFSAFACSAVVVAALSNWLENWMPNVATAFGSLALTVVVVDSVVRAQARQRIKPRLDVVVSEVTDALERLVEAIAIDYIETHVGSYKALPRDMQSILQHWKDEYDSADTARTRVDDEPGFLLRIARLTGESLRETRAANLDILNELEPTLVVAIDDLIREIENISFFYQVFRQSEEGMTSAATAATSEVSSRKSSHSLLCTCKYQARRRNSRSRAGNSSTKSGRTPKASSLTRAGSVVP